MLPSWVVSVLEKISSLNYVQLKLIIKSPAPQPEKEPFLYFLYKKRNSRPLGTPDAFELQELTALLHGIPSIEHEADDAVSKAEAADLDVLLNFSRHILSDVYRGCSRYGVWRYFFSETRDTNVPGVWEVLERRPVTTSGIEVMEANGLKRIIYQSVSLTNPYSIKESQNSYYWKSVSFLPRMLEILHNDVADFKAINITPYSSVKPKQKYLNAPSNFSILDAFVNQMPKRISTKLKSFSIKRDWMLMYDADSYPGKPFRIEDFKELMPPSGFFWADPIVAVKDGKHYIFLEEYVYAQGKGRLSVIEIDDNGSPSEAVPILECPYHLSYPFVFEKDGQYFMIPETSANHTVDLYECVSFPYKWQFKKNLLTDIKAVDSTVIFKDNKWWLFTNVVENAGASSLDELFLFYCDDIINCELKSHHSNPIVSDVRSARPAGPLYYKDGVLFRPSQICAPYYGWGISVNKITKLTEQEYEEDQASVISPDVNNKIAGIHTLAYAGKLCVIDALTDMKK